MSYHLRKQGETTVADLVGRTLGRYEILGVLGAGGMGEVYRARDTELGRAVAVKVIHDEVATSEKAVQRFEREAQTVARLSHPNILNIHDFGRENGVVYAVTELLEGSDLRARMRGTSLPLSKVLEIGIAVANGLSAAHSKQIVHRDVKPENVFVTSSGQVKILDFGVAGLRSALPDGDEPYPDARTQTLTRPGSVVGTVGYMAPEQVMGRAADARSDIFALGCLLYEMLTGHRAFEGATQDETLKAILERDPDPIAASRPDVSPALEVIVGRCLEKQPDERFESARDVAFALHSITGARPAASGSVGPVAPDTRRARAVILAACAAAAIVAAVWTAVVVFRQPPPLPAELRLGVVPFEIAASDDSLRDFGAGLRLGLIDDLALLAQQEQGIDWVVPAETIDAAGTTETVRSLGRSYGATIAVAGVFEPVGNHVRMTLTAVDPATDVELRRVIVEVVPGNIDAFQHGVVRRLSDALEVEISPATRDRIDASATTIATAFDFYTRGRGALAAADNATEFAAVAELLDAAVSEDPTFSGAWVERARCRLEQFRHTGDRALLDMGRGDAARAIELNGRPEAAWRATAAFELEADDAPAAIEALEKGLLAAPGDADLCLDLAEAYRQAGRLDDAEARIRRAIYLRPSYWVGYDRLAKLLLSQGDLEGAAIEFGHIIECVPEYALGYVKLAGVYMYLERPEAAQALLERSLEIETTSFALTNLGTIHFDASRFAEAAEYYRRSIELTADDYELWGNLGYALRFSVGPEQAESAFRQAVDLAEARLADQPDDQGLSVTLAGYHAILGQRERGFELIERVLAVEPTNPLIIQQIAEVFEDLGDRERALEWVERSFDAGVSPERFEGRPTLHRLVADERFRALVSDNAGAL
jgi:serine/threonine-protein kinase